MHGQRPSRFRLRLYAPVELRHLRYFVAVDEHLHVGRAAVELRIAQPSLSHQIRQLERELRTELFTRASRRIRLTEAGRVLLDEARDILAHAERAAVMSRQAGAGTARLRVSYAGWMDVSKILGLVSQVRERHPEVGIELTKMSVAEQIAALREDERRSYPWIYDLTLKMCRKAGFVPRARHLVEDPGVALGLIATGVGIAFAPASMCSPVPGVSFVCLQPGWPMTLTALAWRRADLSPIVGDLIAVVHDAPRQARGPRASNVPKEGLRSF
jgi:DNA-binding transcriptional LysR family regulator